MTISLLLNHFDVLLRKGQPILFALFVLKTQPTYQYYTSYSLQQPPDEMHLRLYPLVDGKLLKYRLPALEKPSLQTSGRLRIVQIKKYIIQRLGKIDSILPKSVSHKLCD